MDAANGDRDESMSATPMDDGTAVASSVGIGANIDGDVLRVTDTPAHELAGHGSHHHPDGRYSRARRQETASPTETTVFA